MGARVHFVFKQDESGKNVTLYSHWGADSWEIDLAYALEKAQPRWDDPTYATRIVVSQLVGDQWQSETGFGLYVTDDTSEFWDEVVIIDFVKKTVNDRPFDTHVKYGQAKEEYTNA